MDDARTCHNCGVGAELDAAFCASCGHALARPDVNGNGVPVDEQPTEKIGVGAPPAAERAAGPATPPPPPPGAWQAPPTAPHQLPPEYAQPQVGWQQPV